MHGHDEKSMGGREGDNTDWETVVISENNGGLSGPGAGNEKRGKKWLFT